MMSDHVYEAFKAVAQPGSSIAVYLSSGAEFGGDVTVFDGQYVTLLDTEQFDDATLVTIPIFNIDAWSVTNKNKENTDAE